jgi:hypothetical protein
MAAEDSKELPEQLKHIAPLLRAKAQLSIISDMLASVLSEVDAAIDGELAKAKDQTNA